MGIIEILTIILITLKVAKVIKWSWWVVFTPLLLNFLYYFILEGLDVLFMWIS